MIKSQTLIGKDDLYLIFHFSAFLFIYCHLWRKKPSQRSLSAEKMKIRHKIVRAGRSSKAVHRRLRLFTYTTSNSSFVSKPPGGKRHVLQRKRWLGEPIDPITPRLFSFCLDVIAFCHTATHDTWWSQWAIKSVWTQGQSSGSRTIDSVSLLKRAQSIKPIRGPAFLF